MKKTPVTSRDVARLAGVSQSAVSRCFSPGASISEEKRKKILEAAKTLGYRPNTIARSLITRSSKTIAVVLSNLDNLFYSLVMEKASHYFQQEGYHLLLFISPPDGKCDAVIDEILRSQVEGILMLSVTLTEALARECAESGVPVVVINRPTNFNGISQVSSDNYHGGYWAGSFLAAAGHERIAYIAGLADSLTSKLRYQGFIEALAAYGKQCRATEIGDYQFEGARLAARRLFTGRPAPDAVFAANDHMAIAVMETLRYEYDLRIPEDVSVIGFDDTPIAAWPSYRLTTVRQPIELMVEKATELLLGQILMGRVEPQQVVLPVTPILRESAKRPPLMAADDDAISG